MRRCGTRSASIRTFLGEIRYRPDKTAAMQEAAQGGADR